MNSTIQSQIRDVTERLGVKPQHVRDDQYVQVSRAAIESLSVVGFRRDDHDEEFTDWEIVATAEDPEAARFGYYSVRELAALHPEWLVAMSLPAGWAFRFDGDTLVDCVSQDGRTIGLNMKVRAS